MKKLFVLLFLLTLMFPNTKNVLAQTQGVITYEVTVNNHRMLTGEREAVKAENQSLYKPLIEDDDEEEQHTGGGGGRFRFRMAGGTNYFDQSTSIMLSQMDLMGKKYLITDTLRPAPWKFGTETKVIQGFDCMQAYYTTDDDRKQTVTAWYTSKLRPMLGPERYNTLPGAVLAVDINNGERVLVAKKIEVRELKKNELKAPTEGEKITQAEFRKKGEELRKQFRGSGGNVIIRN